MTDNEFTYPPEAARATIERLKEERNAAQAERDLAEQARDNWREAATESANNAAALRSELEEWTSERREGEKAQNRRHERDNLRKAFAELERLHDASIAETVVARRERDELLRKVEDLEDLLNDHGVPRF